MCSARLRLCLQRQGQAARWHCRQQGGSPSPAHRGGSEHSNARTPAPSDGGELHLAAGCRTPYMLHQHRAKAGQGTLQSSGIGTGCRVIL